MVNYSTPLAKPIRPMTIDDLLFQLTSRGYVKSADLGPPDENGQCRCWGPKHGVPYWRTRASWQNLIDDMDYLSIYPCIEGDEEGDTFVFVVFNPRNGVIEDWRIGEHWTGDDFLLKGCCSLEMALFAHRNWLSQVTAEPD